MKLLHVYVILIGQILESIAVTQDSMPELLLWLDKYWMIVYWIKSISELKTAAALVRITIFFMQLLLSSTISPQALHRLEIAKHSASVNN